MRSKFIVRFVDIVLILLFGFIAVSRVQESSKIELPTSENVPKATLNVGYFISVAITREGLYLVDQESTVLRTVDALRSYLRKETSKIEKKLVQVNLRSQFNAPIRFAMSAAQICDELGLTKLLDVEMKRKTES